MRKRVASIGAISCLCLILAACPQVTPDNAASAVNKYALSLSSVQDAEIKLHDDKKVSDSTHLTILEAEKVASKAGREMDAGVALAASGADPSQYIDLAKKTFTDLSSVISSDPNASQGLSTLINVAGDALQNAISIISALRQQHAGATPAPTKSSNMPFSPWLFLPMFGFAAIGVGGGMAAALELIKLCIALEPAAVDLVTKFATSLKGKSTAEIIALNETIFDKVDNVANAEEAKLKNPSA